MKTVRGIPIEEREHRFCRTCNTVTPRNGRGRCSPCQKRVAQAYHARKTASGGDFSTVIRQKLVEERGTCCPLCDTPWGNVRRHTQHPDTPWHFDHIISPKHGGTNADENCRLICWVCNLEKCDKEA